MKISHNFIVLNFNILYNVINSYFIQVIINNNDVAFILILFKFNGILMQKITSPFK